CSVIVISGVLNRPGLAAGVAAVTTFCSFGSTRPLVVIAPGSVVAATLNCVGDTIAVTATFVLFQPAGALPDVVTMSPTFKAFAPTVVNVSAPVAKVAAEMPIDRPLTVAVPATVLPRSMKPSLVAGPGSAPPLTMKVVVFGTDATVVLML